MNELSLRAIFFSAFCFAVGALFAYALRSRLSHERVKSFWRKYQIYCLVINALGAVILFGSRELIIAVHSVLFLIAAHEMYRISGPLRPWMKVASSVSFILIAAAFLLFLRDFSKVFVLFVFAAVCLFDAFSQVFGQSLGRYRFAPTLSPGKTWEGVIAGVVAAQVAALVFPLPGWEMKEVIGLAFSISIAALAGDLSASLYKRCAGAKDFSRLIPEHGGILDRFDSFFMAGAICWIMGALTGQG